MSQPTIRNPEAILEILQEACRRHELLILVTPYVRFESNFVRMEAEAVQIAATMTREDATFALRTPDLHLRFPHRIQFLDGATRLLGFGVSGGKRTLRLSLPESLSDDDHRGAYRVERVGRVNVTFSTRKYHLLTGTLVNISVTGCRIHASRDMEDGDVQVEDLIPATIPLTQGIYINSQAKVRYVQNRSIGLEFRPVLPLDLLEPLQRWILQKRMEDHERQANLAALGKEPEGGRPFIHRGLVLVSSNGALANQLAELLAGLPPITRVPATLQAIREIDPTSQTLVLFHVQGLGLDEKRRLKTLADSLGTRLPFMLLGTGLDGSALLELGTELKAAASYALGPTPSPLFRRMVQGILRRHFEEGPGG